MLECPSHPEWQQTASPCARPSHHHHHLLGPNTCLILRGTTLFVCHSFIRSSSPFRPTSTREGPPAAIRPDTASRTVPLAKDLALPLGAFQRLGIESSRVGSSRGVGVRGTIQESKRGRGRLPTAIIGPRGSESDLHLALLEGYKEEGCRSTALRGHTQ
jgi:hypothetical protein